MARKSLFVAYMLWLIGGCGTLGFHRIYMSKFGTAILYMLTGGLFMIGAIYDFFTMPGQIANCNRELTQTNIKQYIVINNNNEKASPEENILKLAQKNKGFVSANELALQCAISFKAAQQLLDSLVSEGRAQMRVNNEGEIFYFINGLGGAGEKNNFAL